MTVHFALLTYVWAFSAGLSSLFLSLLVYRRTGSRRVRYFLAASAVLAAHAAAGALSLYGGQILDGGPRTTLAVANRFLLLISAGFLFHMGFVTVHERLRAPFTGLKKAALSLAVILSPQVLLSSPHVRVPGEIAGVRGGQTLTILSIAAASFFIFLVIAPGKRRDWFAKAMVVPSISFAAFAVSETIPLLCASARPFPLSALGYLSLSASNILLILRTRGAPPGPGRAETRGERERFHDLLEQRCVSKREREILCCIAEGCSNKQIADNLFISVSTVKTHLYHLFTKLEVESRFELMRMLQRLDPSSRS